jgi:hypothetical protein
VTGGGGAGVQFKGYVLVNLWVFFPWPQAGAPWSSIRKNIIFKHPVALFYIQ